MTERTIPELVDLFRGLPGVEPHKRDGGIIAGQVGRYGAPLVERVLRLHGAMIGAATNPWQYFVRVCEGESQRAEKVRPALLDVPVVLEPEEAAANIARIAEMAATIGRRVS